MQAATGQASSPRTSNSCYIYIMNEQPKIESESEKEERMIRETIDRIRRTLEDSLTQNVEESMLISKRNIEGLLSNMGVPFKTVEISEDYRKSDRPFSLRADIKISHNWPTDKGRNPEETYTLSVSLDR